jgi:hypothetical protein
MIEGDIVNTSQAYLKFNEAFTSALNEIDHMQYFDVNVRNEIKEVVQSFATYRVDLDSPRSNSFWQNSHLLFDSNVRSKR